MQETIQTRHNDHEEIQSNDKNVARAEDEKILATVPSRVVRGRDRMNEPNPEVYRQALRVMLETPETESHLSEITAALIVSVFGGWLGVKLTRTRAFALVADLVLFFSSIALAGFFIGVLLGEEFLPLDLVPLLLFLFAAIALLMMGIVLGDMLRIATAKPRTRFEKDEPPGRAVIEHTPPTRSDARHSGTA